jgi:tetratricopeptide (TPR) repeat protein
MLIGFLITGPFFLMYANFSLDSEFSKATVIRFYMLSTIFIVIGAYLGLIWLNGKINQAKNTAHENRDAIAIAHGLFLSLVVAVVINLGINNVPKYDNLTYHFAKTTISQVEENAIVMITGDIPTMTLQYMQAVEDQKKNRIIFSPGQFHLEWFQKQLRRRYPDLKIPEPYKGKMFTTVTQVVDANLEKHPMYVSPEFLDIDPELAKKYLLWPKGLLLKVEKPKTEYKLEPYLDENTRLYASINLNDFAVLRTKSYQLESPLITFYARHFFNVGAILSRVHRYDDALLQFERSLSIDPSFSENYKSIGNIFYLEKDYPKKDKAQALQYYAKYLQSTTKISVEEFNAVSEVMKQINNELNQEQEKAENELKQAQEVEKIPATESATVATESATPSQ